MPELPEVETTRLGIGPTIHGRELKAITIRQPQLRWPITNDVHKAHGQWLESVSRRAKYLLLDFQTGSLLIHLGMSGSLRVVEPGAQVSKHDHVDFRFGGNRLLRFNDPRRFGSLHWATAPALEHKLLATLGPEPLSDDFDGDWLYRRARNRQQAVKAFLMDQKNVVGVGNIYASEALHLAGIHPRRPAGRISKARYQVLAGACKQVLAQAIEAGGTTLRDFVGGDGKPGYFKQSLRVYDRVGEPCAGCGHNIRQEVIGQRASYYCARCQK